MKWAFKSEGEIKTYSEKQKLRESVASRLALQKNVKSEGKWYRSETQNYIKKKNNIREWISEGKMRYILQQCFVNCKNKKL